MNLPFTFILGQNGPMGNEMPNLVTLADQMTKLFFYYMAIQNNKHWPKSIQNLQKYFQNCAKYLINNLNVPNSYKFWPKMAKFRQSSHAGRVLPNPFWRFI